jgi:hypothetical protein
MMKRSVFGRSSLAAVVLSLGLAGCGGGGIDEGLPSAKEKPGVPLDPKMVDMSGRSFSDQKKASAKAAEAAKAPTAAPAEKKE